jgi:hypothetical protein
MAIFDGCSSRDFALFMPSTWFPEVVDYGGANSLPLDKPENILENLMLAYNSRDASLYEKLLADDYRFYMSISLEGFYKRENITPDQAVWNSEVISEGNTTVTKYYTDKTKDISSVRNLFSYSGSVSDISLFFQYSLLESDGDTVLYAMRNISLTITRRNPFEQFIVNDGQGTASLVKLIRAPTTNEWKLYRWIDNTYNSGDFLIE